MASFAESSLEGQRSSRLQAPWVGSGLESPDWRPHSKAFSLSLPGRHFSGPAPDDRPDPQTQPTLHSEG